MAYNGSGVFERPVSDYVFDTVISETDMNTEMDGIATGLSNAICKDGQTVITANIPLASHKLTGLANGAARTDSIAYGQVQDGVANWVDGGGTADAITATYSPALTALVDGQLCYVRATAANATTTPTFSPNGLTARTIVKTGGVDLAAGDIVGDGHQLILRYDSSSTRWELLNPTTSTSGLLANVVEDTTPQLGGDLDLNGHGIVFPAATITDVLDEDNMASDSATKGATQQSIKAYVDTTVAAAHVSPPLFTQGSTAIGTGTTKAVTGINASGAVNHIKIWGSGISQNAANTTLCIQLGDAGGMETTNDGSYVGSGYFLPTPGILNTVGLNLTDANNFDDATTWTGVIDLTHLGSNLWMFEAHGFFSTTIAWSAVGTKQLSAELTQFQWTTVPGTAAFDGGTFQLVAW